MVKMALPQEDLVMPRALKLMFKRFWKDNCGAVDLFSYMLLATIVGIGVLCGLTKLRNQTVQECGDICVALTSLDQSYEFRFNGKKHWYTDRRAGKAKDEKGKEPAGICVSKPAAEEGQKNRK